eukprot:1073535-Pelagomonas_calceolata.AAC.3
MAYRMKSCAEQVCDIYKLTRRVVPAGPPEQHYEGFHTPCVHVPSPERSWKRHKKVLCGTQRQLYLPKNPYCKNRCMLKLAPTDQHSRNQAALSSSVSEQLAS